MPYSNNIGKIISIITIIALCVLSIIFFVKLLPTILIAGFAIWCVYKAYDYIKLKFNKKSYKKNYKKNSNTNFYKDSTNDIPDISKENVIDVDYEELKNN
ncbi:hypothetical protein [Clostridium niameyense]|uniref:hypothetical protein n=1 Tax=Clostridium niameyense TaxID=1622073 RepID=UPI00067E78FE|nr:hypothetical protein [Clostridium niameyense]